MNEHSVTISNEEYDRLQEAARRGFDAKGGSYEDRKWTPDTFTHWSFVEKPEFQSICGCLVNVNDCENGWAAEDQADLEAMLNSFEGDKSRYRFFVRVVRNSTVWDGEKLVEQVPASRLLHLTAVPTEPPMQGLVSRSETELEAAQAKFWLAVWKAKSEVKKSGDRALTALDELLAEARAAAGNIPLTESQGRSLAEAVAQVARLRTKITGTQETQ